LQTISIDESVELLSITVTSVFGYVNFVIDSRLGLITLSPFQFSTRIVTNGRFFGIPSVRPSLWPTRGVDVEN